MVFCKYSRTHAHLLTLDLLGREVVTLHRVAPALAVAPAREGRGLGTGPQRGQGHRPRLGAKTDGALQDEEESSVQSKTKKDRKLSCVLLQSLQQVCLHAVGLGWDWGAY